MAQNVPRSGPDPSTKSLHPVRPRRGEPVLPARRLPLRTGLGHPHQL